MKKIKLYLKSEKFLIIILIIIGLIIFSFFSYYPFGLIRENYANVVYIKLINNFPNGLSIRIEPFFIFLGWLVKKITSLNTILVIVLFKYFILIFQTYFFFRIMRLLSSDKIIAFCLTLLYLLSFSYFSIADNLLRNSLGGLFLLIIIYLCFQLNQKQKKNRRFFYILSAGLSLGLLGWTHILPFLIIVAVLILSILIYFIFFRSQIILKNMTAILGLGIIIAAPYLIDLFKSKADLTDYQYAFNISTTTENLPSFWLQKLSQYLIKTLRFIFEYRDVSMPLMIAFIILVSIIFLLIKRRRSYQVIFVLLLWAITYFGTKLDFFGISVLPYRFNLMMVFPSLFILTLILKELWNLLAQRAGKMFLLFLVMAAFLGQNLPNILEVTYLRNFDFLGREKEIVRQAIVDNHIQITDHDRILNYGTQIQTLEPNWDYLFEPGILQEKDPVKAYNQCQKQKVKYLFINDLAKNRLAQGIGTNLVFDFDKFFDTRYFTQLAVFDFSFSRGYIFQVNNQPREIKEISSNRYQQTLNYSSLYETNIAFDHLINHQKINHWEVIINIESHDFLLEKITTDNQDIIIDYDSVDLEEIIQIQDHLIGQEVIINLPKLAARQNYKNIYYNFNLTNGVILNRSSIKIVDRYLTEVSYNQLRVLGQDVNSSSVQILYFNRMEYKFIIRLAILLLMLLISVVYLGLSHQPIQAIWQTKPIGKFSQNITKGGLIIFYIIVIIEMLFSPWLIEFYKNLIGA